MRPVLNAHQLTMDITSLRIIYAGTPDFAVPALEALVKNGHQVVAVYTQPDRRAGRGRKLVFSPVKAKAVELSIPVMQPLSLKDADVQQSMQALDADVMVVAAYGLILPKAVLTAPKYGCLNIHASLLPRWRGAAPIQRAIEAGDKQSGVTIMQMDIGLDTGDMLHIESCPIEQNTTGQQLHDTLATLGSDALIKTLATLLAGSLKPVKQDDSLATYAGKLDKSEALINWQDSAVNIHRRICAFNAWPVAQTVFTGETLRVWESALLDIEKSSHAAGEIIDTTDGLDVATGDGVVRLLRVQAPGKKPVAIRDFLNSREVSNGMQLE